MLISPYRWVHSELYRVDARYIVIFLIGIRKVSEPIPLCSGNVSNYVARTELNASEHHNMGIRPTFMVVGVYNSK